MKLTQRPLEKDKRAKIFSKKAELGAAERMNARRGLRNLLRAPC